MTREEMAQTVEALALLCQYGKSTQCDRIAAELRKTCAGCKAFGTLEIEAFDGLSRRDLPWCAATQSQVPADGTGFCHRYEVN